MAPVLRLHPDDPDDRPITVVRGSSFADIYLRSDWDAREPRSAMPQLGDLRGVIVHHTATPNSGTTVDRLLSIQRYHQEERGWSDIAYHLFVDRWGDVWEGRDHLAAGDSHTEYDMAGQIQVALLGDFDEHEPSTRQVSAARDLALSFGVPISAHSDHAETACPGRFLLSHVHNWERSR
jgi:hypothetical protein